MCTGRCYGDELCILYGIQAASSCAQEGATVMSCASYTEYKPLRHVHRKVQRIQALLNMQRQYIKQGHISAILASIYHINELIDQMCAYKSICIKNMHCTKGSVSTLFRSAVDDINDAVQVIRSMHAKNRALMSQLVHAQSLKMKRRGAAVHAPSFPDGAQNILIDSEV